MYNEVTLARSVIKPTIIQNPALPYLKTLVSISCS
jgi:hypothetical protein